MLVAEGYKQTEVGVIPEDWQIRPVEEIAKVIDSLHATPKFSNDGYPMVRVTDIKVGNLNLDNALKVSANVFKDFTRNYLPRCGNIVLSRVGSYGVSSFVETSEPFCMGQNTVVIESKIPSKFLYCALNSKYIRKAIEDGSFGSGYKSLSLRNIKDLKVLIPPTKAEQEAIAEALSDADSLIESLQQLIAKKRQIKQGAMQELLQPKDDWVEKSLGELGVFAKGSGVKKDQAASGDLACIRYGEIYTVHNDVVRHFVSKVSAEVAKTATRLKQGDLLFAGSGETKAEIGKCVAFIHDIEAYAGGDIVILRPVNCCSTFMGYYLNTRTIQLQKASKGQGDAVVHISASALSAITLYIPQTIEEQTRIATILSDMDSEITALETKLTKAQQIKQGVMSELLTGKTRLV